MVPKRGPFSFAIGAPTRRMAEPGFDTPFYRRFLNQKGGTANIFFTACVCLLSVRVMTQRQEHEAEVRALNGQMEELRGEIDRLNNRGWFGFGAGNGKKESGGDAAKPRSEPKARAAKPTKGGEKVLI